MSIEHMHSYLVHPARGVGDPPAIKGTEVPHSGKLFSLLTTVYENAPNECDIDISFNHSVQGGQTNECRTLLLEYVAGPTLARGRRIAERLAAFTTNRSRMGLLFLLAGKEGKENRIVISRFPADSAILAEESQTDLSVEFLERVFMKSATAYKAAIYQHASLKSGFWIGRAVDKQINQSDVHLSNYWILEFLDSDFRTTSAAGTRRLAVAMRDAAKASGDVSVKAEIAAAATLAANLKGQRLSIREFSDKFGLSDSATSILAAQIKPPSLMTQRFQFDREEFAAQVPFRSVELDNGAMLTAGSFEFDEIFEKEILDKKGDQVRFSTEGKITSERLGKGR